MTEVPWEEKEIKIFGMSSKSKGSLYHVPGNWDWGHVVFLFSYCHFIMGFLFHVTLRSIEYCFLFQKSLLSIYFAMNTFLDHSELLSILSFLCRFMLSCYKSFIDLDQITSGKFVLTMPLCNSRCQHTESSGLIRNILMFCISFWLPMIFANGSRITPL